MGPGLDRVLPHVSVDADDIQTNVVAGSGPEPEPELALLLHQLKLVLPDQPKPKITALLSPPPIPL